MDTNMFIGIVGSAASIVSFFMAFRNAKSRALHLIYAIILVAGTCVGMWAFTRANKERDAYKAKLEYNTSITNAARALLSTIHYVSEYDVGENRGIILAGLAFLEKHKVDFPQSYEIAKKLVVDGVKVTESAGFFGQETYDERKRMSDGAQAVKALLRGIAGEENK